MLPEKLNISENLNSDGSESEQDINIQENSSDSDESEQDIGIQDDNVVQKKGTDKKQNSFNMNESESEDEDSDDSDDSSDNKSEEFNHQWEELRVDAPDIEDSTRRIAVCNMDWDRIRAVDLLVCFNSFKPPSGTIYSVKIYPTEFGKERMEAEKLHGPAELVEKTLSLDAEEVEDKKGSKYHREKLRQYQINRLKYYFAVVDCDSVETADVLHNELNGIEYESSSIRFDLRFIPDDMSFENDVPTDVAESVDYETYKPRLFVTSALQQVKVDLTWDETDPKRREVFEKAFEDPDSVADDIRAYVASASSESEEEEDNEDTEIDKKLKTEDRIAKYKELLKSIEEKEKGKKEEKYDAEVTWESGLKEKTEEKVKEKMKKDSLTPFEEKLQKKKEEKKMKKKELKMQMQAEDSDDDSEAELSDAASNAKSEKNKKLAELALMSNYNEDADNEDKLKKKKKEKDMDLDGFVPDMNDPRFSAMHKSSLFNMVRSDQHPKKNDGNFGSKQQKRKKFKSKNHESYKNPKKARHH